MKKNILLVSNQRTNNKGVGNPIIQRMYRTLEASDRVGNVVFLPFDNRWATFFMIRKVAHQFDIVHVHFGGLYALIVWFFLLGLRKKTFITFHGTDIHAKSLKTTKSLMKKLKIILNQKASFFSIVLYDKCGFVSKQMLSYLPKILLIRYETKFFVQALGVDYQTFVPLPVSEAQKKLSLPTGHYVLFSDVANTPIKRRDIAESIISSLGDNFKLLVMCGVKPNEVPDYLNASDFVLLTSDEEGSPNIVREALAINKRVYSVDVGDVRKQLEGLRNSLIISRNPKDAAKVILDNLKISYVDDTRIRLQNVLEFNRVSETIMELYERI